ncbi:MAG: methyl-accepting chemotaxis protein [Lachnospiraceae bacterium]
MFKKMKLKKYLLFIFTLMILLIGVLAVSNISGIISLRTNANYLIDNVTEADAAIKQSRIAVNIAARDLREILLMDENADYSSLSSNIQNQLAEVENQISIFKRAHGESDGLAARYESAFQNWKAIANRALTEIQKGDRESARKIILNECSAALTNLVSVAREIDQYVNTAVTESQNKVKVLTGTYMAIAIAVFAVSIVLAVGLAITTIRQLTGVIAKIQGAVDELAKGNLDVQVDYEAANEFGYLVEKMNFSFSELSTYVHAVDQAMEKLSQGDFVWSADIEFLGDFRNIQESIITFKKNLGGALTELMSVAAQVDTGAGQVASGSQALAQGATEQASSVEELSDRISQISGQISKTSEYAQHADELGKKSETVVRKSQDEMKQMLQAIHDIAAASENIQKIIKVIDDIAFQTNILALNAAVEAARAGNAGKGFAVVADEVRNLAQKSADAAKNTTELIGNSLEHVQHGEKLASSTDEAFDQVAAQVTQILEMVNKIAEASRGQAVSAAQITQSVEQISSVVQMNSATSEESAAASEELSGQAGMMKNLLNRFKLSDAVSGNYNYAPADTAPAMGGANISRGDSGKY